jgi:hypothetical protein
MDSCVSRQGTLVSWRARHSSRRCLGLRHRLTQEVVYEAFSAHEVRLGAPCTGLLPEEGSKGNDEARIEGR